MAILLNLVKKKVPYFKLLCTPVQAVRTESRYKCQFGSNSLIFTSLKLSSSPRDRE